MAKFKVGDRVVPTKDFDFPIEYLVEKVNKTTLWVRVAPGFGYETVQGGKKVESLYLYKGVRYYHVKKKGNLA